MEARSFHSSAAARLVFRLSRELVSTGRRFDAARELLRGVFACVVLRDSFRVSLGFPQVFGQLIRGRDSE